MTTTTQIAHPNGGPPAELLEKVLLTGDLSELTADERLDYYSRVCRSVGLNPLTRPFEYLYLSGRLILYARKDATEQLAAIHSISIDLSDGQVIDGVYVVRARAIQVDRYADATGAVAIEHLTGEPKANALLKAETKAARRAVLRLVGLGWLDETEVEAVPGATTIEVDAETGEIREPTPKGRASKSLPAPPKEPAASKADKHAPLHEWLASNDRTLQDVGRVIKTKPDARNINGFLKDQGIKNWQQFFNLLEEAWSAESQTTAIEAEVGSPSDAQTTIIDAYEPDDAHEGSPADEPVDAHEGSPADEPVDANEGSPADEPDEAHLANDDSPDFRPARKDVFLSTGELLEWARDSFGLTSNDIVQLAADAIPDSGVATALELQPHINDERLLTAIEQVGSSEPE